jgi:virulence factor Mce-like protein
LATGFGVLAVLGALLTGCGVSALDLPLPTPGVPGQGYHLTAVFRDALNLPDAAHVKLNGDDVGAVEKITARDYTARVTMKVRSDVVLPVGTTAELRQATPLGEIFLALHPPKRPTSPAVLHDGDVIGLPDTATAVSVEDLLVTVSTLVNGGGLAQIQTIVHELNAGLDGRSVQTAHLLVQTTGVFNTLNARTADIDRILARTRDLAAILNQRHDSIDRAFSGLTPAINVLADQTDRLSRTLHRIGEVSDTGDHLVDRGGHDLRGLLRNVGPVLDDFSNTRSIMAPSLRSLVGLGQTIEQHSKGESLTGKGSINVVPLVVTPLPGDQLPGLNDFEDGGKSFAQVLEHNLSTLGGTR